MATNPNCTLPIIYIYTEELEKGSPQGLGVVAVCRDKQTEVIVVPTTTTTKAKMPEDVDYTVSKCTVDLLLRT
jgi:hypothetical protein